MTVSIADLMSQLGVSITSLARIYADLGDPTDLSTIRRRIRRRLSTDGEPPGEGIAFLNLLLTVRRATAPLNALQPNDCPSTSAQVPLSKSTSLNE
jgi:hypothetical protein